MLRALLTFVLIALPAAAADVRMVRSEVTITAGQPAFLALVRTRMIGASVKYTASSSDPKVVTAVPALFARGKRVAFAELTALGPGKAVITVGDEAKCTVIVKAGPGPRVRILAPVQGAVLWGEVTLAASVGARGKIARVRWLVDGKAHHTDTSGEPLSIVPLTAAPGARRIAVIATDARGRSARSEVRVAFVAGKATTTVEAERLRSAPRENQRAGSPPALPEPGASGGKVAALYTPAETLDWQVTVPADGWYQLIATARGDHYLTEPELAIQLDSPFVHPVRIAPIATRRRLARHAVGPPIRLRKGKRRLIVSFPNDGFDKPTGRDRNAYVDRLELRRLETLPDPLAPSVTLLRPSFWLNLVSGALEVDVIARDNHRVVRTELLADGAVVASTPGGRLRTRVAADVLRGVRKIEARATDPAGNVGHSRAVRIHRLRFEGLSPAVMRVDARQARGRTERDVRAVGGRAALLRPRAKGVSFEIDVARGGRYALRLVARRISEHGRAPARILISVANAHRIVGEPRTVSVATDHYASTAPVELALGPGRHRLTAEVRGGAAAMLARVTLRQRGVDRSAPVINWRRPKANATLAGRGVVVLDVGDNDRVARVELLVDGRVVSWAGHGGRVGLWVPAGVGRSRLTVRAVDVEGNQATLTREVRRAARGTSLAGAERAVHLLDRLGLGASAEDAADVLATGADGEVWLDSQLALTAQHDARALAVERAVFAADPIRAFSARTARLAGLRLTRRPLRERMALFWDNHFSTWIGKSEPRLEMLEVSRFRALATGRFADLLRASATSPAMLAYLDQGASKRGRLNENYARELLELHTLGADGGYDQADVAAVARILTGWNAARGGNRLQFATDDAAHARGATIFGVRFDGASAATAGDRLLALLAAHPSTARHIARKLAVAFVDDQPAAALVDRLAASFTHSGGSITAVLRRLFESPQFFAIARYRSKIADPLELTVRWLRLGVNDLALDADDKAVNLLGMTLFGRITPDGYPERGGRWLSATALLQRWNLAERISRRLDLERMIGPLDIPRDRDALIDHLALTLVGRPLGSRSRETVRAAFPRLRVASEAQLRALVALILQMPEAQHQ